MNKSDFDLEEFIIKNHNPNNQYYLIKQNILNLDKEVFVFDEFLDMDNFRLFQKIDIFRGTVQYLEEFLLYFLAKFKDNEYAEVLARTDNRSIFVEMDEILKLDDLVDLLVHKFELNESNVGEFIIILKYIMRFFIVYKEVYNSIKHGFRVYPYNFNYFMLGNDEIPYERFDISDDYIQFVCKKDDVYTLAFPIDCLVEDSQVVLEYIHESFNFIMRKNYYENSKDFECLTEKEFTNYVSLRNGESTIFFKSDEWFDKYLQSNPLKFYAKFSKSKNKIVISLSVVPEYPFLILIKNKELLTTAPDVFNIEKIELIAYSDHADIEQIQIINNLGKSAENFKLFVEFNDNEYECSNFDLGELADFDFEEDLINKLIILKNILGIEVNYPFKLAEKQYELLAEHDGRFDKRSDAQNFVDELKKYNRDVVDVFLNVVDLEGKLVENRFLGHTYNLNILNYFKSNDDSIDEKWISGTTIKNISSEIFFVLSTVQKGLFNGENLNDLEKYDFLNEINVKISYLDKLWNNEYHIYIVAYIV